ncbi:MAG: helix-turn-helix transcriptional regulator [Dinghuibacter sp.]|nr:helix-turn-helix transcriptional regulator [Dinghuibacter sp.]
MLFVYDHNDHEQYLHHLAAFLGTKVTNDTLYLPEQVGSGFIRLLRFPGGLKAVVNNFQLHTDFTWRRISLLPEFFVFRADIIEIEQGLYVRVDDESYSDESLLYSSAIITSSRYRLDAELKKGTRVKGVNFILHPEWLEQYFPANITKKWLNYFRYNKLNTINMAPLDFDAREALFKLIALEPGDPAFNLHAITRVLEICDYYFKKINIHSAHWAQQRKKMGDIDKLVELDNLLTRELGQPIPAIEEMAQQVHMSISKFKTLFKEVYGQSVHDYFTTSRLNRARHLLTHEQATVKETSLALGYTSVSNFSAAFKKQFGVSPVRLMHSNRLRDAN